MNEWADPQHAEAYLAVRDGLDVRREGDAVLMAEMPGHVTRILDLGCGDGYLLDLLLQRYPEAKGVALDFSPPMLERARERFAANDRVTVVDHNLDDKLPDLGRFDCVASSFAIHHCSDQRKREIFAEVFAMLNGGGIFCNLEHVDSPNDRVHDRFMKALNLTDADEDPSNQLVDVESQLRWLRQIGYEDVDCYWKWRELALLIGFRPVDEEADEPPESTASSGSSDSWNAGLYQDSHAYVWELASSLIDLLNPQPGEQILDLGCGTGQLTARIADSGATVTGLDRSEAMVEQARLSFPGLTFTRADAHSFEWREPVDAVFSNAALHWIERPQEVANCVAKALKPGGRFVAEFGGQGNIQCISTGIQQAAAAILPDADRTPWYFPSVAQFSTVLENAGFEISMATLFDRPTELQGPDGLKNWVRMFGQHWLDRIPAEQQAGFLQQVEDTVRPELFRDNTWYADYRRIRVVAKKRS